VIGPVDDMILMASELLGSETELPEVRAIYDGLRRRGEKVELGRLYEASREYMLVRPTVPLSH
jgi:hypothetical protein